MNLCYHNSRLLAYRAPFGAVAGGALVTLRLDLAKDCSARLRLWMDAREVIVYGERNEGGQMEFSFRAPKTPGLVWYYFLIDSPKGSFSYGARSGEGRIFTEGPVEDYQITVYDESYSTPDWFQKTIVYQIFPDRFYREGRGGLSRLAYHEGLGRRVYAHEAWEEEPLYLPLPGALHYDPCDFFGGDLAGIRKKLPYLAELGVGCIYLNPIFESPSNHRYNTADYEKVDPVLGDEEELKALVREAETYGIRLMLDGVFSHTGADSVYFDRFNRYGNGAYQHKNSPYIHWYDFTDYPKRYRSWWGFESLPEVNELSPDYMEFIEKLLARYAAMGICNWRLDVADELPDEFIAFLRKKLKALSPEGVLLGEVWEDASNKMGYGRRRYVDGEELDSVMGYPFREAVCGFLLGHFDARAFVDRLFRLRENYPEPFYRAHLNLLGSHDTVRVLTVLSEAPHRDALSREEQARYRPDAAAAARGRKRLPLAMLLQFAHPGVPSLYYGDEAGLTGMADPFCRKPYPWGREDEELLSFTKTLLRFRKNSSALREGLTGFFAPHPDAAAVLRQTETESCLLLVNRSAAEVEVSLCTEDFREGPDGPELCLAPAYRDVFDGEEYVPQKGRLLVKLPPYGGKLLSCKEVRDML